MMVMYIVHIVEKMCRFAPDDRYQSMDAVLLDLEALTDGGLVKYQKRHKETLTLFGMVSLIAGMAMWKLTFLPELEFVLSAGSYVFLGLCVLKFIQARQKEEWILLRFVMLVLGGWLCFSTGFAWWKPLLLLVLFAENILGGFWAIAVLTANVTYLMAGKDAGLVRGMQAYRWVAITLLPIACALIFQLYTITAQERGGRRNRYLTVMFLQINLPWIVLAIFFGSVLLWGWMFTALMTETARQILQGLFGAGFIPAVLSIQPFKAGTAGLVFSIFWVVRQRILMRKER